MLVAKLLRRLPDDWGTQRSEFAIDGRAPLFDLLVIFQNFESGPGFDDFESGPGFDRMLKDVAIETAEIDTGTSLNDMLWEFRESGGQLQWKIRYNTDLFSEEQVNALASHFGVLASAVVYYAVYSVLWVLFWPVRAWMKKNRPEDYAASQLK